MPAPGVPMHVVLLGALAALQESMAAELPAACLPSFLRRTTLDCESMVAMSIHGLNDEIHRVKIILRGHNARDHPGTANQLAHGFQCTWLCVHTSKRSQPWYPLAGPSP